MSTRININVDQAPLLQRSRDQTQANRLGFLEGQNRKKVEAEARRQRDANRAARGLTANGSMYNNRLRPLPQRPDPAAWRLSPDYLPYFWYWETAVSINSINHTKLILVSGDGSSTAEYTFNTPNIQDYLAVTRPSLDAPPAWPFVDQFYITGSITNLGPRPPAIARDYRESSSASADRSQCVLDGNPILLTAPDGFTTTRTATRQRRKVHAIFDTGNTRSRFLVLPLGNRQALLVYYVRQAAFHNIIRVEETANTMPVSVGNETVPNQSSSRVVTWQTAYSHSVQNEKLNQLDDEEHVCFLAGQSTVQQIPTPPLLLAQLRLHVGELQEQSAQGTYTFFPACDNYVYTYPSNAWNYPSAPSYVDPANGQTKIGFLFSYDEIGYQRVGEAFSFADFSSSQSYLHNASYGVLYRGSVDQGDQGCSPLSYFFLDSIAAASLITEASTHEQLRAVTSPGLSGAAVSSLLTFSNYYGLPFDGYQLSDKLLDDKQALFKGSGNPFEGNLYGENYPYDGPAWRSRKSVAKKGAGRPSIFAAPIFITDWGSSAFCRQQAARYGISL